MKFLAGFILFFVIVTLVDWFNKWRSKCEWREMCVAARHFPDNDDIPLSDKRNEKAGKPIQS